MPRYIDANLLKEQMESVCMGIMAGTDPYNAPLKTIDDAPTANVVQVIACKDCVHLELLEDSEWYYAQCNWHGKLFPRFGKPDTRYWFCADCERR